MIKWFGYTESETKLTNDTGSNKKKNGMNNYWLLCKDKTNVGGKRSDYKKIALPKRQRTEASYSPQTGSSKCHNSQDWIPLCLQECLQAFNEHWIKLQKNRDRNSQFAAKFMPSVRQDHMHFIHSLFIVYFTSLTSKKTHFLTLPMTSSVSLALFPTGHPVKVTHETTPYFHTFCV